jgi:hypothetical protein
MWFHVDITTIYEDTQSLQECTRFRGIAELPISNGRERRPTSGHDLGLVASHHSSAELVGVDTCGTGVTTICWSMHMITLTATAKITMIYSMKIDPCREFSKMAISQNILLDKPISLLLAVAV